MAGENGAYWIKLNVSEFDDPRWLIIESFPEVADAVEVIYIKLLCLAGKANDGGKLILPGPGGKPYGEAELAAVLRKQPATVRAALQLLENYGFLEREGGIGTDGMAQPECGCSGDASEAKKARRGAEKEEIQ